MGYRKQSWQGWVALFIAAGLIGVLAGEVLWPAPVLLAAFGKAAWFFPVFLFAYATRVSLQNQNAEPLMPIAPLVFLLPVAFFLLAAGSDPSTGGLVGSVGESITRPVYLYGGKTALWLTGIGGMALCVFLFVRALGILEKIPDAEYALAGEAPHPFGYTETFTERPGRAIHGSIRRDLLRAQKLRARAVSPDADEYAWPSDERADAGYARTPDERAYREHAHNTERSAPIHKYTGHETTRVYEQPAPIHGYAWKPDNLATDPYPWPPFGGKGINIELPDEQTSKRERAWPSDERAFPEHAHNTEPAPIHGHTQAAERPIESVWVPDERAFREQTHTEPERAEYEAAHTRPPNTDERATAPIHERTQAAERPIESVWVPDERAYPQPAPPDERANERAALRAFCERAHNAERVPFFTRLIVESPDTSEKDTPSGYFASVVQPLAPDVLPAAAQPAEFPLGNIFPEDDSDTAPPDEDAYLQKFAADCALPDEPCADVSYFTEDSAPAAVGVTDAPVKDDSPPVNGFAVNMVLAPDNAMISYKEPPAEERAPDCFAALAMTEPEESLSIPDAAHTQARDTGSEKFTGALNPPKRIHAKPIPYRKPDAALLVKSIAQIDEDTRAHMQNTAKQLEQTFSEFGIEARVTNICRGPVITQYEVMVPPGIRLSRVVALQDNIALNLAAASVRIEAPIPGKAAIGIEVPNLKRSIVTLRDILESADFQNSRARIPLALGETVSGAPMVADLASMPHLIIAGTTGSGKSVCVNAIICSILFHMSPAHARLILVDPKYVEMAPYNGIPHLLIPVINKPRDAILALRWLVREMEDRYQRLQSLGARNIESYNERSDEHMPYLILVIDELADLMLLAAKEIEDSISRLAAMSRAVGIHLIFATQRPSVDVLTGVIKNNFPARIAFQVASTIDSRTILDAKGADKLLGKGDSLFMGPGSPGARRVQGAFLSEAEVEKTTAYLQSLGEPQYQMDILDDDTSTTDDDADDYASEDDPLYEDAVSIVLTTQRASASYLQRRLKIGYNRSSRMVERMEKDGIVGPQIGSKPREIFASAKA